MNKYRLTYFPAGAGGKAIKQALDDSELKPQHYVVHIRGLQQAGGQGALPGIIDVHLGTILVEQLSGVSGAGTEPFTVEQFVVCSYLIAEAGPVELQKAREAFEQVGVRGLSVPAGVRMLANLLDKSEKSNTIMVARLNNLQQDYDELQRKAQTAGNV